MSDLLQPLPVRSWFDRLAAVRDLRWSRPVVAGAGALVAVAVLVAVGLSFLGSSTPAPKLTLPRAEAGSAPADGSDASPAPAPAPTDSAPSTSPAVGAGPSKSAAGVGAGGGPATSVAATPPVTVVVYVAGQVASPGVYALASGGRVADAVLAAGGASAEADVEQLNLAARVSDGERIYVPRKGEAALPAAGGSSPGAPAGPASTGPVDLNTATAEQLEALPGVGPATSKAILTYRTSHGRFRSVTELLEVPGIGPAKLEALRPMVRV